MAARKSRPLMTCSPRCLRATPRTSSMDGLGVATRYFASASVSALCASVACSSVIGTICASSAIVSWFSSDVVHERLDLGLA